MNLIHLEYFRAVANAGSMTKAAEKLHVTQPTLSNSIKALEQELGVQLFERRGRSLALNSTGVEFLKSVNSIFGLFGSKKQLAAVTGSEHCKEITIGSMRTESQLLQVITKYMRLHPDVLFRTVSRGRMDANRDGELSDFLVSPYQESLSKRHSCCLFDSEQYVVIPKTHRLANQDVIDIHELSDEVQILCTTPDITIPRSLSNCIQAGLKPNVRYIADDRFSAIAMLVHGAGIMFMPKDDALLIEKMGGGQIVVRPLCSDTLPETWRSHVYLSWADTGALSEQARSFLDFVMKELNLEEVPH